MVKKESEVWSQKKAQSTEMLNGVVHKVAKMVHEEVAEPPPSQGENDGMQTMEHDRRRKQADAVDALMGLEDAGKMDNHALAGSEGLQVDAPASSEGLDHGAFNQPPLEMKPPDRIMSALSSNNPFLHSQASKNPFVQPHPELRPTANDLHPYSHPVRSDSYPANHPFPRQAHSCAMSVPLLEQKKHKPFPVIQSSTGQFNITHVGRDQNFVDSSSHVTNFNSGNTTTTITRNSNNDSSIRLGIVDPQQYVHNMRPGNIVPPFALAKHLSAKSP